MIFPEVSEDYVPPNVEKPVLKVNLKASGEYTNPP
jgi:hypothetical protein